MCVVDNISIGVMHNDAAGLSNLVTNRRICHTCTCWHYEAQAWDSLFEKWDHHACLGHSEDCMQGVEHGPGPVADGFMHAFHVVVIATEVMAAN